MGAEIETKGVGGGTAGVSAEMKCVQFPTRRSLEDATPSAELLVDGLLSATSLATPGRASPEVVSTRVDHALTTLSPLHQWVIEQAFPIHGGQPRNPGRIASDLNLFPRPEFEQQLLATFGVRVLTAADVQLLINDSLKALRPMPMPKPLTPDGTTRHLRLVA